MSVRIRTIQSSQLSSECWLVQAYGLNYCKRCSSRQRAKCSGLEIRRTKKNAKGFSVGPKGLGAKRR